MEQLNGTLANTLDPSFIFLAALFLALNLLAFCLMLADKIKSENEGSQRISEGMLFFLAAAFGSLGIYAGMFAFRHKNRKWHFLFGIPLLFIENIATLYIIYAIITGLKGGL